MAGIGIWLWSDPSKFGQPLAPGCDPTLTVVGVPARFSSKPLRIVSLTMYSLVLIPGLNLIPPFAFFLFLHISYNWCWREQSNKAQALGNVKQAEDSPVRPIPWFGRTPPLLLTLIMRTTEHHFTTYKLAIGS